MLAKLWAALVSLVKRIFSLRANQDGTLDTASPNGDKPPPAPLPAWGDLTAIRTAIAQTTFGTTTTISTRDVLTGISAPTATLSFQSASGADPTAAGFTQAGDDLVIAGAGTVSVQGSINLVATVPEGTVVSDPIPWTRAAIAQPNPTPGYKWHPGIYPRHTLINCDLATQITFINQCAAIGGAVKGVTLWFSWRAVEPTQGNYDFSAILAQANAVKAKGLRYIIMLTSTSFGNDGNICPAYVPVYKKATGSNAYIAKKWDSATNTFWLNLLAALSAAFDADPAFEGITGDETDPGFGQTEFAASGFNSANYLTERLRESTFLTGIFPTSLKWIGANFLPAQTQMTTLARDIFSKTKFGLGVMPPDLIPGKRTAWALEVFFGNDYNGTAWVPSVPSYQGKALYEAQIQDPEEGGKAGQFKPADFIAEMVALGIHHSIVADKNYPWPVATGGLQPNQQTYWDSSQAADDSFRWRQSLIALPTWSTNQSAPPALSTQ